MRITVLRCLLVGSLVGVLAGCGPTRNPAQGSDADIEIDAPVVDPPGPDAPPPCPRVCSEDQRDVLDCHGDVIVRCGPMDACDISSPQCTNACDAAQSNHRSIGCDYYAVHMDSQSPDYCFAVFVANTWTSPAKISVEHAGASLAIESFARLPVGSGPSLTYAPYNAATGIAPGQVAVLFLGGGSGQAPMCPVPTAVPLARRTGTGISSAFHITTDVPVVAYQINPYGGGAAAVTASSLLLPSSVWDVSYVAVNATASSAGGSPSFNIIAREDGTIATITPRVTVAGGNGVPMGAPGVPLQIPLSRGQHAQITQTAELTGSIISSNKPVGFMAGQTCMNMPTNVAYCDHGEQMLPPIRALGHEYVGVMYRPRTANETSTFWRLVGTVDGTQLTWSSNVGGPPTLRRGESVLFQTGTPFVVSSQDGDHPFMLFGYMTSSQFVPGGSGYGDPDFVVNVPPEQYLKQYVFFTDPTYPETNLVLVRSRGADQQFHDVELDCAGEVQGWQPVGANHEYTRVDLMRGNFSPVGNCSTGRHEIRSSAPFGLWVWGWGTPGTTPDTRNVSYGYPGGMNVAPINDVIIN